MMVVSEQSGFCNYVNNYICLNDHDLVILTKEDGKVTFEKKDEYHMKEVIKGDYKFTPEPYPHWTIKEINEQYDASLRTMGMGGRILDEKEVKLGGLESHTDYLKYIDHLILLGCGTSYNAGLYCVNIFKSLSGFDTVQIFDGAEFSRYDIPKRGKTGILMLSQSGETRDLIRCISIAKEHNLFMIGVINVVDSYIAREVQCGVYLNAGREVAVASTKAFTSQVIVLHLIAIWFAQIRGLNEIKRYDIIDSIRRLPLDIKSTITTCHDKCKDIAKYLYDKNSLFVLGKGNCEAVAKESSLKIKEIGYIHAEGYNSSALKHGPYSLCIKGTPIIVIAPNDKYFSKNNNIIEEIHARDGYIIGISDTIVSDKCTVKIKIPKNYIFAGLLGTIPSQLIAYELALLKGHNPDKPRGLAKVVTVD
jgi:glucosamine--fructose-6-phosphate aminotransferase (isomerizing)